MRKISTKLLTTLILLTIAGVVTSNYMEEFAIDNSKLPEKMENGNQFQRWIINQKKRVEISADEFRFKEQNEVFNSAYLSIESSDNDDAYNQHLALLEEHMEFEDVRFSPNKFQFLDFRHKFRGVNPRGEPYAPNNVYYHALREDKIIDTMILSCKEEANCYFDRAFFLDNHTFVISEYSRPITKQEIKDETFEICSLEEVCEYTIKLHLIDLINSSRTVYESEPKTINLAEMVEFF